MKGNLAYLALVLLVGLVLIWTFGAARAAGDAALLVNPPAANAGVGWAATFDFDLNSADNTQGVDVTFSFDPALVEVVDADGVTGGVQVAPGDCPAPDFVVLNSVDNGTGSGRYAAISLSGTCSQGTVFTVALRCLAAGTSPVAIEEATISDPNGIPIPHATFSGAVTCLPESIYLPIVMRK